MAIKPIFLIGGAVAAFLFVKSQDDAKKAAADKAAAEARANPVNQFIDVSGRVIGQLGPAIGGFFGGLAGELGKTQSGGPADQLGYASENQQSYDTGGASYTEPQQYG